MPSIPQSLLWISLVVLWLFVLVPMLINKRDTVRRTSDVALATRVLNSGSRSRLRKRSGPAAGHRHDPDWQRDEAEFEAEFDEGSDAESGDRQVQEFPEGDLGAPVRVHTRSVMVLASVTEEVSYEPDYLDVDIVDENSGALPVGGAAAGVQASLFDTLTADSEENVVETAAFESVPEQTAEELTAPLPIVEPVAEHSEVSADTSDLDADEYEYIDDTSGLEAEYEPAPAPRRNRRQSSATAEAVSARKYQFRKRVLTVMAAILILTAVLSFTVSSGLWWACGTTATVTVLYLAYLRRQTRIEEQVRRRRQQRMARSGLMDRRSDRDAPEPELDREFEAAPPRLQRPGTVVLDIDDEDPIFEHLDEVAYSRRGYDLPRAAGQ